MPPSRDADSRDAILGSVEAGFAEQIAHTRELVRFPSVRGAEHAIQDFVFRAFRSRGFAMERSRSSGRRSSAIPAAASSATPIRRRRSWSASIVPARKGGAR